MVDRGADLNIWQRGIGAIAQVLVILLATVWAARSAGPADEHSPGLALAGGILAGIVVAGMSMIGLAARSGELFADVATGVRRDRNTAVWVGASLRATIGLAAFVLPRGGAP